MKKTAKLKVHPDQGMLLTPEDLAAGSDVAVLNRLSADVNACIKCRRGELRTTFGACACLGEGPTQRPLIAFIGEGPTSGSARDREAFTGKTWDLIEKMLRALGLFREEVYACNAMCCWDYQPPSPPEIAACRPYLLEQLRAVRPQAIVCLGSIAARSLLEKNIALDHFRDRWWEWEKTPVRVTIHPSTVLSAEPQAQGYIKREMWVDMLETLKILKLPPPKEQ